MQGWQGAASRGLLRAHGLVRRYGWTALGWAAVLGCVGLSFLTYWPRLGDYFVYDDFVWLRAVRNHAFPTVLIRAFTFPTAEPFDEVTFFWRPLVDIYFYGGRVFGLHPEPYHAVNLLVHGLVGGLGLTFVWRLSGSLAAGVVSGLLFTVAPTYDFAVTWISQVSELLGALFLLSAMLCYHTYLTVRRVSVWSLSGALVFVVLGLLSKESTVILVVLLPALAVAVHDEERVRTWDEVVRSLTPVVVMAAVFGAIMLAHEYRTEGDAYEIGRHMVKNLWDYLTWMVFPYRFGSEVGWRAAGAATFLVAGTLAVVARQRAPAFLFLWAIAALLPFAGFKAGIELRYTYLAALPFTAFVVSSGVALVRHLPSVAARPAAVGLGVAVVVALIVTPIRTRDQQAFLTREAGRYETMVASVRGLCGGMPEGGQVFIKDPPYRDLFRISTPAAVNLFYDGVRAHPVTDLPELIAFVENTCVIEYDAGAGEYRRVMEF